jgi:hypothetical protein
MGRLAAELCASAAARACPGGFAWRREDGAGGVGVVASWRRRRGGSSSRRSARAGAATPGSAAAWRRDAGSCSGGRRGAQACGVVEAWPPWSWFPAGSRSGSGRSTACTGVASGCQWGLLRVVSGVALALGRAGGAFDFRPGICSCGSWAAGWWRRQCRDVGTAVSGSALVWRGAPRSEVQCGCVAAVFAA